MNFHTSISLIILEEIYWFIFRHELLVSCMYFPGIISTIEEALQECDKTGITKYYKQVLWL